MAGIQTLYIVLGVIIAAGTITRGLFKIAKAVHTLLAAVKENTTQTKANTEQNKKLSAEVAELRETTHHQLDHAIERIARLEGGRHEAAADPQRQIGRGSGPGPHRGRGLGPV